MREVTSCNLCGNKSFATAYRSMHDRMHKVKGEPFSIIRCKRCSLLVTSPIITTPQEFRRYYPEHYYSYNPPAEKSFADRLALFFYNLFYNPAQKMNPLRYLLYPLSPFVRGTRVLPGKKLLDIGCGGGFFLQRMKDLGMEPYGIELGERGVRECRKKGIKVWDAPVEKARIRSDFFDVITISAVLEHVVDVKATLTASHRILKKDGLLVIMVPNAEGFSARHYRECWAEWDVPRHITHFTKRTARQYLEEAGFEVLKIKNVGSSFQFTQSLLYKYPNMGWLFSSRAVAMLSNIPVLITNLLGVPGRIEIYATKR